MTQSPLVGQASYTVKHLLADMAQTQASGDTEDPLQKDSSVKHKLLCQESRFDQVLMRRAS